MTRSHLFRLGLEFSFVVLGVVLESMGLTRYGLFRRERRRICTAFRRDVRMRSAARLGSMRSSSARAER